MTAVHQGESLIQGKSSQPVPQQCTAQTLCRAPIELLQKNCRIVEDYCRIVQNYCRIFEDNAQSGTISLCIQVVKYSKSPKWRWSHQRGTTTTRVHRSNFMSSTSSLGVLHTANPYRIGEFVMATAFDYTKGAPCTFQTVVQYFSKPCYKSTFLGAELTTRTPQQCPLNWPTLVFGVLQLFREEFGRIRKMPRVRNKQKSVQGWIFVPVANSNFRLHLREPLKTKSPPKLLNFP